jgi:hypothetical protein
MQKCLNLFINFKLLFIMKTLNVSAYGVEEMNGQEMIIENGGFLQFVLGAIVGELVYDLWKTGVSSYANGTLDVSARHTVMGLR